MGGGVFDYVAVTEKDPFLKLFTMGVVNQKPCFTCSYRNQTAADIRLGDYWGERFKDTEDGISMVLVNTGKGNNLMEAIKNQIAFSRQDIKERLGQQHTDFKYPEHYDVSLEMLRDDQVQLKSVINLYETDFDRFKSRMKKLIKPLLGM